MIKFTQMRWIDGYRGEDSMIVSRNYAFPSRSRVQILSINYIIRIEIPFFQVRGYNDEYLNTSKLGLMDRYKRAAGFML